MALEDLKQLAFSPIGLGAIALSVASVGLYIGSRASSSSNGGPSLPPGPPPSFLIGNLLQFPKHHMSDGFSEWAKTYGDIVHVKIPGMRVVIINSYEVAQDLLSKRPNTTGGRRAGFMLREIMGLDWGLPNINPGPTHSEVRKMLRRGIGPQRVAHHDPMIEKRAGGLLLKLQTLEGNPGPIIMNEVGRLVTTVTYGEEMWTTMGEELTAWNLEEMHYINEAFFGFWPVDIINSLRFIPTWVPGATFKKIGARAKWLSHQIRNKPFEKVKALYDSGTLGPSLAADLLEEFGEKQNTQDSLAIMYLTGSDTTSSAITAFFHALYLFPEVAQKVYEEIQEVTDGTRLPTVKDRANLPYTEAVWKEIFRWNPFFLLNIPHVNERDDTLNGYLIPKGTVVMTNNGFMLTDPRVWGDPDVFRPERFLGPGAENLPSPLTITFGYGMRVCPGMYLADRIGFHYSVSMATLFSIVPLQGRKAPDPKTVVMSDTALRLPQGFECRFVPRGEKAKHLLKTLALGD